MSKFKILISVILVFTLFSCKKSLQLQQATSKPKTTKVNVVAVDAKTKVGKNNYEQAIARTNKFATDLNFNLDYIRKKGLADKKFLAEYLGLFVKLKKAAKSDSDQTAIMTKLNPFYQKTLAPSFHNMATVDNKMFKKNSMSYMRILWLLNELGFDNTFYKKELAKVQKRMDDHMAIRGEWQKAVFDKYYDYFKIKKPIVLKYANKLKGPITYQKPISYYDRSKAYILTHFVFAAYDYGNKIKQTRFTKNDINYLGKILPQIIAKFEAKNNDDIVGELLTCLVLIRKDKTSSFNQSYNRLIRRQNKDGSFGSYERVRNKIGSDVEFRQYLHTTLVDIEMFIEYEIRKNLKK